VVDLRQLFSTMLNTVCHTVTTSASCPNYHHHHHGRFSVGLLRA